MCDRRNVHSKIVDASSLSLNFQTERPFCGHPDVSVRWFTPQARTPSRPVLPFLPIHRWGHPENSVFLLSFKNHFWIKASKKILFYIIWVHFENRSTIPQQCTCTVYWQHSWAPSRSSAISGIAWHHVYLAGSDRTNVANFHVKIPLNSQPL